MWWKGEKLETIGDLMDKGINRCATREEAQEFMTLYRVENEYADANIGYLSGYYSQEEMARIQDWFGCTHPIFGKSKPTVKDALDAGSKMGGLGEPM